VTPFWLAAVTVLLTGCDARSLGVDTEAGVFHRRDKVTQPHTVDSARKVYAMPLQVQTPSYVAPWGDGTRSSHIATPRKALSAISSVATFERWNAALDPWATTKRGIGSPVFVLVDLESTHVVLCHMGDHVTNFSGGTVSASADGEVLRAVFGRPVGVMLWREGIFFDGSGVTHALSTAHLEVSREARIGHASAMRFADNRLTAVRQLPPVPHPHGGKPLRPKELAVTVHAFHRTDAEDRADLHASDSLEGVEGLGAIAEDGAVALVTTDGRFVAYNGEPSPAGSDALRISDKSLGYVPYDISFSGDEIAIIEAGGTSSPVAAYRWEDDLAYAFPSLGVGWSTRLHVLDRHGRETSHVDVGFEALMPPILAGSGRTYVAGMGLAAIDGGRIAWIHRSKSIVRATAFQDGELAVTTGAHLQLVGRDGVIRQEFSTPGETIETPPAIGPDGAVWFATGKALYVAR
jgi:hypothetical protein